VIIELLHGRLSTSKVLAETPVVTTDGVKVTDASWNFRRVRARARGTEPRRLGTGTRDLRRGTITLRYAGGNGREARFLLRGLSAGDRSNKRTDKRNALKYLTCPLFPKNGTGGAGDRSDSATDVLTAPGNGQRRHRESSLKLVIQPLISGSLSG
jgi:hypothetical protein